VGGADRRFVDDLPRLGDPDREEPARVAHVQPLRSSTFWKPISEEQLERDRQGVSGGVRGTQPEGALIAKQPR